MTIMSIYLVLASSHSCDETFSDSFIQILTKTIYYKVNAVPGEPSGIVLDEYFKTVNYGLARLTLSGDILTHE